MSVSAAFKSFALGQLDRVAPQEVHERQLFGALSVFTGERHIGLLDHDKLFLKADDVVKHEFDAAGFEAFCPVGDGHAMPYYEVPEDVLEHPDTLRPWVERAVAAAERQHPTEAGEPKWRIKRLKRRRKRKKKKR